ncbi:type II toxin-antitoxin system YafQ family toxin [Enterococcus sp. 669A]|uniref:Type II toxin-antitoxin system YafQ family toxin n=1 Tax=Candidatus Enterococcus moelleringii TaxID=2815325 RepID=A0ABS3L8D8_9ENTE|nr:type II toxin-antitoxin system YafQ family toxin [Enterococcus sp. 669A]MBO1305889.1 type II toxin-antitoxin system YafQ family toxin [Enterococcus sp. 669A]
MLRIRETPTFKRDFKRIKKKHYDMHKLKVAVSLIVAQEKETLIRKYKDHSLVGNWQGYRELHIQKDWLLIYRIDENELILTLTRTGSHDEIL